MPLILPHNLPAIALLRQEGVHVLDASEPEAQTANPLRIAILNIMPTKEATEADLARVLACSHLPVEVHLMKLRSHTPRHASPEHMERHYRYFGDMKGERFDGVIITGAPVEHLDYPQVGYWQELCEILDWCRQSVRSTLNVCWASQATMFYYYGVPKHSLPKKMFGVFPQTPLQPQLPLFQGLEEGFNMPHSRHTELRREDIERVPDLQIVAESPISGVSVVIAQEGREVYFTGHAEYSPYTLDSEYRRDLNKGLPIQIPYNYYEGDDMTRPVLFTWHEHGKQLYLNWLNYYVCQETPLG